MKDTLAGYLRIEGAVRESPVFGIISDLPLESIDRKFKDVAKAAKNLGVPFPQPMLSLITLTGAAIPYLRICEEGLVNLKDGETVDLIVD